MDVLSAIQVLALKSVLKPDYAYHIRKICRWYSEKFHTPLHEVEELPVEYVLTQYFESQFEDMSEEELEEERQKLFLSKDKLAEDAKNKDFEAAEEFDFAKFTAEQAKLDAEKKKEAEISTLQAAKPAPMPVRPMPEAELVSKSTIKAPDLPDFKFEFVDHNLLDDESGFGGMAPPPPKKKS